MNKKSSDIKNMSVSEYIRVIVGVLIDFRVIGTLIVCILVIEFAKFVTTYRKRPPKPKDKKKTVAQKEEEPKPETSESGEATEE